MSESAAPAAGIEGMPAGGRLARRVSILVAGVALPLLLVMLTLTWAAADQRDAARQARTSMSTIADVLHVQKLVLDIETGQRGYILTGDADLLAPSDAARPRVQPAADALVSEAGTAGQRRRARDIAARVRTYLADYSDPIVAARKHDHKHLAERIRSGVGERQLNGIRADVARFRNVEQQYSDQRVEHADHVARIALFSGICGAVLAAALLAFLAMYLRRTIVQPILELTEAAGSIEAGDLRTRVVVVHRDEIGRLATGFNEMADALARAHDDLVAERAAVEQQAERLARSNADLEQFAYAAAHDLQEPLRSVASYTSLLQRRYAGQLDDDADDFIGFAVEGATRMQQLINDLLQYSRLSTRDTEYGVVSLTSVAHDARINLSAAIDEAGAEVIVPGLLPDVTASASRLALLLQNLIGNAIKFRGQRPPRVELTATRRADGRVEVRVADNGIGIQPEHHERIFRLFQRLNSRTEYSGTGIGLTLCKRIVERHGGSIHVEDTKGGGTTFVFDLLGADSGAVPRP